MFKKYIYLLSVFFSSLLCSLNIISSKNRDRIQRKMNSILYFNGCIIPSKLAIEYLAGLNGIEIGASEQNSFHLTNPDVCKIIGGYANVDFSANQGDKWQKKKFKSAIVNIVASGDNLPFNDNSLDYVLSSHVIEHFFDPIKTIKEWLRVIKKDGYIFIIVPHKDRTFDRNREPTPLSELIARHNQELKISDYARPSTDADVQEYFASIGKKQEGMSTSEIPDILIKDNIELPKNWSIYTEDDHHHWSVWRTQNFLDLCKEFRWNVVNYQDVDDKIGNGFTIVIKK